MKKLLYLICFALLQFVCACTIPHRNCCTLPQPSTKVTAEKNGTSWSTVYARGYLSDLDSLSISATTVGFQSSVLNKIDTLNIKILYNTPGTYQLQGNDAFYGVFNNNVLTAYHLDPSYNNAIIITHYDRVNGDVPNGPYYAEIKGTFNLRFIDPNSSTGITFQSGNFYSMLAK